MRPDRDQELLNFTTLIARADLGALDLARLAAKRHPALGRVLLAQAGGLLDAAEAHLLLSGAAPEVTDPAVLGALDALPEPPAAPGEAEVWIRGLAARLLAPAALPDADVPPPSTPLLGTLSGVWSDEARWTLAVSEALRGATQTGPPRLTLALSSWGAWIGARALLTRRFGSAVGGVGAPIAVITLEEAVGLLSAAWTWNLPDLAPLLHSPLLLDGVDSLDAATLAAVSDLCADTARVFGQPVRLMSAEPLALPGWSEWATPEQQVLPSSGPAFPDAQSMTLGELAKAVRGDQTHTQQVRTLVLLPSRGSAARLTALLPGSVLWSSSLCPAHLEDLAARLQRRRQAGEEPVMVATALPPLQLGPFDTVWHTEAPLPYLAEAWRCCAARFQRFRLRDVALPVGWMPVLDLTHRLQEQRPPNALAAYRSATRRTTPPPEAPDFRAIRAAQDYASLAAALQVRPATSRPALIAYDAEARRVADTAERSGHLPTSALRYAAWLTPSEVQRALHRGQARTLGWALRWDGPYDPVYGLAAELVEESRGAYGH